MRYFFHCAYKGTRYRGWQRQPGVANVQEVVEKALGQLTKMEITVWGCGRTDAGVHASQFFFHADLPQPPSKEFLFRLSKLLPPDVVVFEAIAMEDRQHARYDASQRTYNYYIHTRNDPFLHDVSSFYPEHSLDFRSMKEAAALFLRHTDYRSFCKTPGNHKHTRCQVSAADLYLNAAGNRIRFQVSADRFLGRMVRAMVSALLEVGRGNWQVTDLEQRLLHKEVQPPFRVAFPQGLHLTKVTYPYLSLPVQSEFALLIQGEAEEWMHVS